MAVIGRITGVALEPGVSANGRLYTPAMVAGAAERARERITNGGLPLTMLTHHAAEDDSTRITGHITKVDVRPDGALTYEADVVGNPAGEAVLAAAEAGSLQSVSIRGKFTGPVRTVAHEGQQVVTAEGLELDGVDWTRQPGVKGARVTSVSRMARESAQDSHRVICESLPTPAVERITEDLPDDLAAVREARDAAEAYLQVRGTTGPATVSVSAAPLGNEDVSGAAAALGQAFQAAMRSLDPDMDDDMHLPDGSELPDPFGGDLAYQSHATDTTREESPMPEDTTESAPAEETAAETTEATAPVLDEAAMGRLADMVAERLRPAATETAAPAAAETTETEVVDPAAVAREAATAAVGEAVTGIGEALAGKVAEAVAGVKDDIRRELVASGVVTPRAGLVATAEAAPEKPLHEMDRDERNAFYSERFAIAFAGGRPMAAQRA